MYEIPFPKDFTMTTQTIIFLDQFINCPYYITPRSIFVTDEKKSMELHLFSGDLRKYGLIKAIERQKKLYFGIKKVDFYSKGAILYTYLEIKYGTETKRSTLCQQKHLQEP